MCAPLSKNLAAPSQFLVPTQQRSFAVSEKDLKARMKTVKNIQKITKAMKMVATSKMKADLIRLMNGKNFGVGSVDMMFTLDKYMADRAPKVSDSPQELLVSVTSDKGMCGGINSGIVKEVKGYISHRDRSKCEIFCVGDKATSALAR